MSRHKNNVSGHDRMEVLEECMSEYGTEIKRVIFSYVRNHSDTDDITQDVFFTVYKKLNDFKGESSLKTWIYRIAINKSKDYLRSLNVRENKLINKLKNNTNTINNNPEALSIQTETSNELLTEVYQLPLKYREVIILYYFEDLDTQEISDALDVNINTVKARLRRARERLKERLELNGGESIG
ncbi:sigma-70 family RNA polymerase sigma factor [Bacillaceae bacterium W0354]